MDNEKINVTRPSMPSYEEYIEAIKPLWDSHWLTNMGTYHKQLEKELKDYLEVDYVSLMVNGHMALELAIQAFDFPKGSEIITTPFTFISTTHAIVRNGLQPVFCDVKVSDGTIDEAKIEELISDKTVAILPVHVYGNICNIEQIQIIADKYNLKVIYDAAHAFGEKYKGKGIGSYGDASVFSFHATKVFNTIEGGAVTFSDSSLYEKLYNLKNFGIRGEELVVEVGANAKMNEFSAIMGLCNLKHIDQAIQTRKQKWLFYREKLEGIKGISFFRENDDVVRNYAYFPIMITDDYPIGRDQLYNVLRKKNIFVRKYFYPLTSEQKCYKRVYYKYECDNAKCLAEKVLVIPFYETIRFSQMNKIIQILKQSSKCVI